MTVTLIVVLVGGVVAVALAAVSRARSIEADPIDPEAAEHWLVALAQRRPRVRRALLAADRRVVGGVAIAVTFTVVFIAALAVGWLFDSVDSGGGFARWDESVASWGSEHATPTSTDVLRVITRLGDTYVLLPAMALLGLWKAVRRHSAAVLAFLATVGVGVSLLNNGLKWLVMRDRPTVPSLVDHGGSSFPSGHSAGAAACWAAIALVVGLSVRRAYRPLLAGAAAGIAGSVGASRALLGVHWLTDVIAGVLVGWSWFFVVALIFGGRLQRLGEPAERVAAEASPQ